MPKYCKKWESLKKDPKRMAARLEKMRMWRENNPERHNAIARKSMEKFRTNNPEAYAKTNKLYYDKNEIYIKMYHQFLYLDKNWSNSV